MTPSITLWLLLMFSANGTVTVVTTSASQEECLKTLTTAPKTAQAYCVEAKMSAPKDR
jgi:hypothetical protein